MTTLYSFWCFLYQVGATTEELLRSVCRQNSFSSFVLYAAVSTRECVWLCRSVCLCVCLCGCLIRRRLRSQLDCFSNSRRHYLCVSMSVPLLWLSVCLSCLSIGQPGNAVLCVCAVCAVCAVCVCMWKKEKMKGALKREGTNAMLIGRLSIGTLWKEEPEGGWLYR